MIETDPYQCAGPCGGFGNGIQFSRSTRSRLFHEYVLTSRCSLG